MVVRRIKSNFEMGDAYVNLILQRVTQDYFSIEDCTPHAVVSLQIYILHSALRNKTLFSTPEQIQTAVFTW